MLGQVSSIKYLLLLNAEILFVGADCNLILKRFASDLAGTYFFLLAARTNDFLSFHILQSERGGSGNESDTERQEPRTQCVLDWLVVPGCGTAILVVLAVLVACYPLFVDLRA